MASPRTGLSDYYMPPTKAAPVFREGMEHHAGPHPPFLRRNAAPPPQQQAVPAPAPNAVPQQVEDKP